MFKKILSGVKALGKNLKNGGGSKKKKEPESIDKKIIKIISKSFFWMVSHFFVVISAVVILSISGVSVAVIMPKSPPKKVQVCDTSPATISNSGAATGEWTQDGTEANKVAKEVWDYWNSKGFSAAAIAGIIGNISAEDGTFELERNEMGNGGGAGLYQFTPASKFAPAGDAKWKDPAAQSEWMMVNEVKNRPEYAKITSVQEASESWCDWFERPNPSVAHKDQRAAGAQKAYEMWGSTASQDGSSSVIDQSASNAGTSSSSSSKSNSDSCDDVSSTSNVAAGMIFKKESKGIILNAGLDDANHTNIPGAVPLHGPGAHDGWDVNSIADPSGNSEEDIFAAAAGDVVGLSNGVSGVLQFITLKLSDGSYLEYQEFKAGSIPSSIQKGTKVTAGQKIGQIGDAGSTGGVHSGKYVHITWADKDAQPDSKGSVTGYSANSHTQSFGDLVGIKADKWVNATQQYTWDQMTKIKQ